MDDEDFAEDLINKIKETGLEPTDENFWIMLLLSCSILLNVKDDQND